MTFYNNFGSILVLRVRKEKEKNDITISRNTQSICSSILGNENTVTSPIFKSRQGANYVVREGYRVVEDLQLLEIDLDKIANNENAVVEQYHISSAKVGFRMSEGDDPYEFVLDSISQSECQRIHFIL